MGTQKAMEMVKAVRAKLMAAIALLLVSAIMLGTSTYAWRIISTAPETKEMKVSAGTNGYLEIALQSPQGEGTMSRAQIRQRAGDSLLTVTDRNKTWGNIVELDTDYGLGEIVLFPSRLNIVNQASGIVNTAYYLSVPTFGSDGRIYQLDNTSFVTYRKEAANPFTAGRTYGVNILGTVTDTDSQEETITYHYRRSMIRDEAAGYLEQYRTQLHDEVVSLLEGQQVGIFNLLLRATQLLNSNGQLSTTQTWTADNVSTAKVIINRMITITRDSEVSLKWALLALAIADDTTYPPDDDEAMTKLGTLYREFLTYPLTGDENSIRSIAETNGYTDLVDAIDSITRAEAQLAQAKVYISSEDTVSNACILIIDIQNTLLKNGSEIETDGPGTGIPATGTARTLYAKEGNTTYGMTYNASHNIRSDYLYFIGNPSGPTMGLFSIMANLLGDYQTTEQAYFSARPTGFYGDSNNGARKQYTLYIRGTSKTSVGRFNAEENRGVLGTVYDEIMSYDPGSAMISFSSNKVNVAAYGYSVDLAFRSSENCDLLLQQEALDRVLGLNEQDAEDSGSDARLMGGGSTATFTLSGDLTGTNSGMAKSLMSNIFIVLIDTDSGGILGIVGAEDPQVVLEQGTAQLALYDYTISPEGVISRGGKRDDNVITSLTAEQPAYITAVVFLNGDTLPAGALAATQHPSLYGTINLQFSSSVDLDAMPYSGYVP